MSDARETLEYYSRRAREYERIYARPERREDLERLRGWVGEQLSGRDVLEIACGTGYWTEIAAAGARSILATDMSEAVLEMARAKTYPEGRVRFGIADAWSLAPVQGEFDAGLAAFWWSHVPWRRRTEFLAGWHRRLGIGARCVLLDNRYVEGSSTPIARRDDEGNTYQRRRLDDGSEHEVMKNFPTADQMRATLSPHAASVTIVELDHYWAAAYDVARA